MRAVKAGVCAGSSQRVTTTASSSGSTHTRWPPAPCMNKVAAGALHEHRPRGCTRKGPSVAVEPNQPAVERRDGHRFGHLAHPAFGQQAPALVNPVGQQQLTDARLVARADRNAASPMRAARHRRQPPAVDGDPGFVVGLPGKAVPCAQRLQDLALEDRLEWLAEQVQQGQRQLVDAHVVVFPVAAGGLQRPGITLASGGGPRVLADLAPAVGLVRQAQAAAFPFADLRQQVAPGDGRVVRAVEADAGQLCQHRPVDVGQPVLLLRHAGQQTEVGLGDAEGLVGARGLAPGGDLGTVLPHHAALRAARVQRAEQAVPGRRVLDVDAEALRVVARVARPGGLVGAGEGDRLGQRGG